MAEVRALICLSSIAILIRTVIGATYTVGGSSGWGMGTNYGSWAASQTFKTGDSITFTYGELHNVLEVSKADYDSCSTSNPLTTSADGSTAVKLSSPGKRYFICGVAGHCAAGMKVEINTVAAAANKASPPPSPAISPPPPSPAISPPPPSPAISPPPPPIPSPLHPKHKSPPASPPPQAPSSPLSPSNATSPPPTVAPTAEPSKPKPSVLEATAAPAAQKSAASEFSQVKKVAMGMAVSIMMVMVL